MAKLSSVNKNNRRIKLYKKYSSKRKKLKNKVSGEVAVNFISGAGKEHMSLISALIKLGVGFRLVVSDEGKIEEI